MSYKDFRSYWDQLEICNLSPDALGDDHCATDGGAKWHVKTVEGKICCLNVRKCTLSAYFYAVES